VIFRRPPRDGRRFLSRAVRSLRESTASVWEHHNGFTKRLSCHICQESCPFPTRFAEPAREPGYAARGPGGAAGGGGGRFT
jgi:epoxyqueuosine reductase QueG